MLHEPCLDDADGTRNNARRYDRITLHEIRDFEYRSETDCIRSVPS
jgi:hypothetical protein